MTQITGTGSSELTKNNPSNEDVKDTRFDEYIGMNRAEAKDLTPKKDKQSKTVANMICTQSYQHIKDVMTYTKR